MNKIFLLLIYFSMSSHFGYGQPTNAMTVANKIADKMKDSLGLTQQKRQRIFVVNIQLMNQKARERKQSLNREAIRMSLQNIENKRDSLYKPFLNPVQFATYLQKKKNLVGNN